MSTDKERIEQLEEAYRKLWEQHVSLKEEIRKNYAEFKEIRERMGIPAVKGSPVSGPAGITEAPVLPTAATEPRISPVQEPKRPAMKPTGKSSWEQYVGEQLLSKIGIVILVIGVGIGAKYAIDHQLLSPVMRIASGYVVAALLGFFAYRFREKYTGFSAILVSGAMAVTYFITYAAHIFYGLYPYWLTFLLLLLTTIGTVVAALRYNLVIIAHFGLVGAYVLPALIAAKSAHISNYLVYVAVINCGILVISFLRDWKSLFHVAFGWTTMVFVAWFFTKYDARTSDPVIALGFLTLFFLVFQAVALGYPLVKKHAFRGIDLFLVAPNMLGYFIMGQYVLAGERFAGLDAGFVFGVVIAAFFYALWLVFRSVRPEDKLLQETHFVIATSALTLSFILELEGHHLPFILIIETCVLGWLAIRSQWRFLDILAAVLTIISGCAILWNIASMTYNPLTVSPFANEGFVLSLTGILLAAGTFAVFRRIFAKEELQKYSIPDGLLLLALIGGFCVAGSEIAVYFKHLFAVADGGSHVGYPEQWLASMTMAMTAFTGVYWFFVVWLDRAVIGFRTAKDWMQTVSVILMVVLLLTATLNVPSIFSGAQNEPHLELLYTVSRYLVFAAIAGMGWPWLRSTTKSPRLLAMIHIAILWMLSLEMTHWLTVNGNQNAHKLSLSILWGVYAIYILYVGIVRSFAALRVTAMIILGITLAKLFFYDITKLSTIAKTVLFMLLGGLLLVGAYFYQRYKAPEEKEE